MSKIFVFISIERSLRQKMLKETHGINIRGRYLNENLRNITLLAGNFLHAWKHALVVPLPKISSHLTLCDLQSVSM